MKCDQVNFKEFEMTGYCWSNHSFGELKSKLIGCLALGNCWFGMLEHFVYWLATLIEMNSG